jgi:hypothetical protein
LRTASTQSYVFVAVIVCLLVVFGTLAVTTSTSAPKTSSVTVTSTVNLGNGYTIKVQLLNSTLDVTGSGSVHADFSISSGANTTLYFEVIPNSTIPEACTLVFPHHSFPIANVSLYDGFNASYPAGQALNGTSPGIAAVKLTTTDTTPGEYTLYLCVIQTQSDRLTASTAYAFPVDVTSG